MRKKNGKTAVSGGKGNPLSSNVILPNHVALICDGNRRWAAARDLPTFAGHKRGAEAIKEIARACRDFGVHTFTVWAFSTENWGRDSKEIKGIFRLISKMVDEYLEEAKRDGVRIVHLGRKDRLPTVLLAKFQQAEEETKNNKAYIFNIAVDYGGNDEIMRATKRILKDDVRPEDINRQLFASYLDTANQPYPNVDLLIRTSGEQRLSGILPWQMEYAEIWWEENPLPGFTRERFVEALLDYSRRRRRFGGGDKVRKFKFSPRLVARLELDWWRARRLQDRGGFVATFAHYIKEQFGTSVSIAREAADLFVRAAFVGETKDSKERAKKLFTRFYEFLRDNVKLAFEPSLVANLEIEYLKKSNGEKKLLELQDVVSKLYAELFRIPVLQARKVAHLRLLAHDQEELAQESSGKNRIAFLTKARDYLIHSYEILKERVA